MKTSITAILALAGAATVAAADFPEDMPACGRFCGTDMLRKAPEFNCNADDIACICRNPNFTFGVHDCSVESCPSIEEANKAINWGQQLCAGVNVPVTVSSASSVAGTASASGNPATNTGDAGATTTGSGNDSGENGDATAIATSTWTSTFTSGDATSTVTGTTTISGVNGVPNDSSDAPETTVTSPIVSTHTGESTTFETTIGSTTITGDDAQSTGSDGEGSGAATSTTSSAEGAHMTAAPAFGFLAAAGIAAAFL